MTNRTIAVESMTAIVQDEYGAAPEDVLRLAEIARPTIAADEILVRVRAASVDRGTWHLMAGLPYPMRLAGFGLRRPKAPNPGRSLAGTVESVGQEVTGFEPGDEVYGTFAWSRTACSAVSAETGTAAACPKDRFAGLGASLPARARAYAAKEPSQVP
jgi:NADPH:quinone reductase-like Zn-dependent oxidoreductase